MMPAFKTLYIFLMQFPLQAGSTLLSFFQRVLLFAREILAPRDGKWRLQQDIGFKVRLEPGTGAWVVVRVRRCG